MIETLKQHVLSGGMINEEQAKELAAVPDKEALYEAAHQITRHFMGNKFDTCSIINAKSGNCSEDCKWCAQSGHYKTNVTLYPLLPAEECIRHATHNHKQGISRFALVTSGKKVSYKGCGSRRGLFLYCNGNFPFRCRKGLAVAHGLGVPSRRNI